MRAFIAAMSVLLLGLAGAGAARGQSTDNGNSGTIAVPPAPAIVAAPPSIQAAPLPPVAPPPGLVPSAPPADIDTGDNTQPTQVQTPPPTDNSPADNSGGQSPAAAPPDAEVQDIAPIPPNTWLPATTAKIGVLDKIDGSVSEVSIPVGGQSVVGDLQVNVQACMTRPPDQVPDAAVFLALQSNSDPSAAPNYRGWLIRSAPGAAVAGDASETFRVIDCS